MLKHATLNHAHNGGHDFGYSLDHFGGTQNGTVVNNGMRGDAQLIDRINVKLTSSYFIRLLSETIHGNIRLLHFLEIPYFEQGHFCFSLLEPCGCIHGNAWNHMVSNGIKTVSWEIFWFCLKCPNNASNIEPEPHMR